MACADVQERILELTRGRLAPAAEAEVRRHLATCEACRHEAAAEALLDEALGRALPEAPAPAALRRRVARMMSEAQPGRERSRRAGAPLRWAAAAAAAALLAVAAGGGGYLAGRETAARQGEAGRLADELVTDHLRAVTSVHPHDVESSDTHQVKPWFEGRLPFAPVVPGDRGELRLLGGAVGFVGAAPAAVISYGLRRHRLTLVAFLRAGQPAAAALPGAEPPALEARRGFVVATWAAGDLAYALVGDVPAEELGRLSRELCADTRRAASAP